MNDKKIVPFPFSMWTDLTPPTKRLIIGVVGAVIITAMITGYFPELLNIFGLGE